MALGLITGDEDRLLEGAPPAVRFVRQNPAPVLLASTGAGVAMGILLRQAQHNHELSPAQQVKEGSRALAIAGAAATAAFLARMMGRTKEALQPDELRSKGKWIAQKAQAAMGEVVDRIK